MMRGLLARTSPSGVFVSMLVRLLVVDVWNGIEVGVDVGVDSATSRSRLAWSASGVVAASTGPGSPRCLARVD